VGGTTVIVEKRWLGPDQSLEVGAMEIDDDDSEIIEIGAMEVALLDSAGKDVLKQDAMLVEDYHSLWKALNKQENIAKEYSIKQDMFCWIGRLYAPEVSRK